jgi:hypothetical protein
MPPKVRRRPKLALVQDEPCELEQSFVATSQKFTKHVGGKTVEVRRGRLGRFMIFIVRAHPPRVRVCLCKPATGIVGRVHP